MNENTEHVQLKSTIKFSCTDIDEKLLEKIIRLPIAFS